MALPDTLKGGVRQSHVSNWHRCPTQLWFYLYTGPAKPSIYKITGTAGHMAIEHNLRHRMEKDVSPPLEESLDIFSMHYDAGLLTLDGTDGVDAGKLKDRIVGAGRDPGSLPRLLNVTDTLRPVMVERPFQLEIEELPVPIIGTIDFVADGGLLRDFKFRIGKRTPTQNDIDKSFQLTAYQLGLVSLGVEVATVGEFEIISNPDRSSAVKEISSPARPERELDHAIDEFTSLVRFVDLANGDPGLYAKTNPQNWWCSERFCGWWDKCPRGGGKYE